MRSRLLKMAALAASLILPVTVANCQEQLNRVHANVAGVTTAAAPPAICTI
jgi:hypothetical protein